jgi:hypothetical protein
MTLEAYQQYGKANTMLNSKPIQDILVNTPDAYGMGTRMDEKVLNQAIADGTLNQSQANNIAQKIYKQREMDKVAKYSAGYISPTINWTAQLKKSGYEYKEVPAEVFPEGMQSIRAPFPAHGEAIKIGSASATEPTATSTTGATEESFFAKNKVVLILGAIVAGAGIYYYTQNK